MQPAHIFHVQLFHCQKKLNENKNRTWKQVFGKIIKIQKKKEPEKCVSKHTNNNVVTSPRPYIYDIMAKLSECSE